jgi:hypothetical protein
MNGYGVGIHDEMEVPYFQRRNLAGNAVFNFPQVIGEAR